MSGVHFAHPWVLALLALLPIWGVMQLVPRMRNRRVGTFIHSRFALLTEQGHTWRSRLTWLPDALLMIAAALAIVAMARPQSILAQEVEVEGIDIYLALDMSGSMRGVDMTTQQLNAHIGRGKRPVNRFEYAVRTLEEFITERAYDRIGMVVFARDAYLQFPLTLDYNTIENMLDRLRLGDIDGSGTAIGNALGRAIAGLKDSDAKTRIVILITDGDRRGGNISPMQAAQLAKNLGIKIFPILVGREGPTLEPAGQNLFTNRIKYVERELPVNPELLQEIAEVTNGSYYRATDAEGLKEGLHTILDRFERSRVKDATNVEYNERYRPLLAWAIALLLVQLALRHTLLRTFP
ncbi:MAG: VWA domain-containing protein [Myxococcota bacterium]